MITAEPPEEPTVYSNASLTTTCTGFGWTYPSTTYYPQYGWVCPVCNRGVAYWMTYCPCQPPVSSPAITGESATDSPAGKTDEHDQPPLRTTKCLVCDRYYDPKIGHYCPGGHIPGEAGKDFEQQPLFEN